MAKIVDVALQGLGTCWDHSCVLPGSSWHPVLMEFIPSQAGQEFEQIPPDLEYLEQIPGDPMDLVLGTKNPQHARKASWDEDSGSSPGSSPHSQQETHPRTSHIPGAGVGDVTVQPLKF